MTHPKVLLIEDEEGLVKSLTWYFNREGYETIAVGDGTKGLREARALLPDLVLLDLMLPGMGGLDVCRELRAGETTKHIPIIIITARSEESDQMLGLSLGADDYVTKPFSNKVLLQRVKAVLRRSGSAKYEAAVTEHLGVKMDRVRHLVTVGENRLDLTLTEFRLLGALIRQPGRAFTRNELMDTVIGEHSIVLERTIDVHVKMLRRKMGEIWDGGAELVETVRGVGYRLRET
jgi:two-component system phosphate regulon response regulator PhoB